MNRLLVVLFSVIFGSVVNAAVLNWGTGFNSGSIPSVPNGSALSSVVAYLCIGDVNQMNASVEALLTGTWTAPEIGADGNAVSKVVSVDDSGAYIDNLSGNVAIADEYIGSQSVYIVLVDGQNEYFMVSSVKGTDIVSVTNPGGAESIEWTFDELTEGSGGWGILGGGTLDPEVPEPTALALLALGVAGVALRRRVA